MNDDGMTETRLTELEIKLAHAEQALNELSDVMYAQQNQMEKLERQYEMLQQRIHTVESGGDAGPADEKPPHY